VKITFSMFFVLVERQEGIWPVEILTSELFGYNGKSGNY